jgi:HK97 family phage prohead protease
MHHARLGPKGTRPLAVLNATGVFVGYAALFNRADATGDIIMPGAFRESLKRRGRDGVRMLFQHDPSEPIGAWVDLTETNKGLAVRGRLNMDVQRGRELAALIDGRGLDGLSIGFKAIAARRDRVTGLRRLERVDLWEISLVTFPMQEGARVEKARARADWHRLFGKSSGQGARKA